MQRKAAAGPPFSFVVVPAAGRQPPCSQIPVDAVRRPVPDNAAMSIEEIPPRRRVSAWPEALC